MDEFDEYLTIKLPNGEELKIEEDIAIRYVRNEFNKLKQSQKDKNNKEALEKK